MKKNLYAVAALMTKPDGKGHIIAGWYGAVSEDEAIGIATRAAKDKLPDATVNDLCAILIPLDEMRKIIAQHESPNSTA